jgi:serine/threonine protein kinase
VANLPKGTKLDRFIVEKPLSNIGGTAHVYLATVDGTKHKVAIKVANTDAGFASHEDVLLQWEADILSKWDWRHSGIVRLIPIPLKDRKPEYKVKAISVTNQPWYMVMEYLRGNSLAQNLEPIHKYSLEWKLELFYHILLPLAFIHQKGYAHRDIKPDNIVFRSLISPNKYPDPVLVDFALATDGKDRRSIIDDSYTLEYASPERVIRSMPHIENDNFEPENVQASDIWSLGVVLYEIITGKMLLKGNKEKIRTTIIREQIDPDLPISDERGHILAAFIRSMLNKDPDRRPDIKQVMYALEEKFLPPRIEVQ